MVIWITVVLPRAKFSQKGINKAVVLEVNWVLLPVPSRVIDQEGCIIARNRGLTCGDYTLPPEIPPAPHRGGGLRPEKWAL